MLSLTLLAAITAGHVIGEKKTGRLLYSLIMIYDYQGIFMRVL